MTTVPKRILVLDDDVNILSIYSLALVRAGYTIDTAADGEQGWNALCANDYDLLLTDNDMPRLTGVKLVVRLHRAGITVPVIIASGSVALPDVFTGEWLGLAAVLHKPFTAYELVAAVRQVIPLQQNARASINRWKRPASELTSANPQHCIGRNA